MQACHSGYLDVDHPKQSVAEADSDINRASDGGDIHDLDSDGKCKKSKETPRGASPKSNGAPDSEYFDSDINSRDTSRSGLSVKKSDAGRSGPKAIESARSDIPSSKGLDKRSEAEQDERRSHASSHKQEDKMKSLKSEKSLKSARSQKT